MFSQHSESAVGIRYGVLFIYFFFFILFLPPHDLSDELVILQSSQSYLDVAAPSGPWLQVYGTKHSFRPSAESSLCTHTRCKWLPTLAAASGRCGWSSATHYPMFTGATYVYYFYSNRMGATLLIYCQKCKSSLLQHHIDYLRGLCITYKMPS